MKNKLFVTIITLALTAVFTGCSTNEPEPLGSTEQGSTIKNLKGDNTSGRVSVSVPLGTAANFAVLGATTITNAGESEITGNLAVSPGTAITGFQPSPINSIEGPGTVTAGLGLVSGTIYASGPVAAQAHNDAVVAYQFLIAQAPDTVFSGVSQLDGVTFTPGVYSFAPSANLKVNGTMYLDFQGDSDAQFIFQMGSTLVTMTGSNMIALNNNSTDCAGSNVFWAVGSSATIDGAQLIGTVIAHTTITMTDNATVSGGIWALNGAVTMINDTISACADGDGTSEPAKPCDDFVTGGGWINPKSTFGVSGGIKHNKFWGNLSFSDHAKPHGVKVKSTSVTGYVVLDSVTRKIEGIARVNGKGEFKYTVIVVDNGEPGRNDSFSLTLSNGYNVSGALQGGNIQLHKNCDEASRDENEQKGHHNSN